jgi:protein gp37
MGKDTKISWCHHTFNPWVGCARITQACQLCYAAATAHRFGWDVWGPDKPRHVTSPAYWQEPPRWDRAAFFAAEFRRVFCGSMCDVFEDRRDLDDARKRLWTLIGRTPNLDWLLLTKRPHNIYRLLYDSPLDHAGLPVNLWFGVSAWDNESLHVNWTVLDSELHYSNPAVTFVSLEPLLGPVDLLGPILTERNLGHVDDQWITRVPDWVIVGGESGPGARPMEPAWALDVIGQSQNAGIPVFFKQMGTAWARARRASDYKGADPAEWPEEFRVQQFPLRVGEE